MGPNQTVVLGPNQTGVLKSYLLGDHSESSVVVAPLAARVLDPPPAGDRVRSLMQQDREHVRGAARHQLGGHEQLPASVGHLTTELREVQQDRVAPRRKFVEQIRFLVSFDERALCRWRAA